MNKAFKLGILGSTRGSNLVPLSRKLSEINDAISIDLVISNQENAEILTRARENRWPWLALSSQGISKEDFDMQLSKQFRQKQVDLIVLIGYMRILSAHFIEDWSDNIINVHPSLLPAFAGKMDLAVHQAVLDGNIKETGCTVHQVTTQVDSGPIIVQKKCAVFKNDTVDTLKARVQDLEVDALAQSIQIFYRKKYPL